ncbi:MAG: methyltransferase domain-containing protein [Thermodesulfobacteriota bacterium]
MPASVGRTFSRAARTYGPAAQVQQAVAGTCAALCPAGERGRVLDVGAGTGFLCRALAPRLSWRSYVALDLSPDMLRTHRQNAPEALCVAGDGEAPPFAPASFDLLVSASTLQWFAAPERSLPALFRLLRPGGAFSLAVYTHGALAELAAASAASGFGSVLPLRPAGDWLDLLRRAGAQPQWRTEKRILYFPTVREVLLSLQRTGAAFTPAKRAASRRRYEAFLSAYQDSFATPEGVPATYSVLYAWGEAPHP